MIDLGPPYLPGFREWPRVSAPYFVLWREPLRRVQLCRLFRSGADYLRSSASLPGVENRLPERADQRREAVAAISCVRSRLSQTEILLLLDIPKGRRGGDRSSAPSSWELARAFQFRARYPELSSKPICGCLRSRVLLPRELATRPRNRMQVPAPECYRRFGGPRLARIPFAPRQMIELGGLKLRPQRRIRRWGAEAGFGRGLFCVPYVFQGHRSDVRAAMALTFWRGLPRWRWSRRAGKRLTAGLRWPDERPSAGARRERASQGDPLRRWALRSVSGLRLSAGCGKQRCGNQPRPGKIEPGAVDRYGR